MGAPNTGDNPQDSSLDMDQLQARLVETGLLARLVKVETTGSTNADLLAAAAETDFTETWPHLSVLTAEEQTSGRGRMQRGWASPPGTTLSTSLVLQPSLPPEQRHWLSLTAGLALTGVLRRQGIPASMKWPNDVHVNGRKIAGILAVVPPQKPHTVILGCGINVLQSAEELPVPTATSVLLERPQTTAEMRTELLAAWLADFAELIHRIQGEGDIEPIREDIISAISTIGEEVRLELPDQSAVRGRATAVETDGALTIEVTSRRRTPLDAEAGGGPSHLWEPVAPYRASYNSGDVIHLRYDSA